MIIMEIYMRKNQLAMKVYAMVMMMRTVMTIT